jgi:site-specific DNA-methyltransferase (adenine-specific)
VAKHDVKNSNGLWRAGGAGFTSRTDDWATPQPIFDALDVEFGFDLDACADAANAKCSRFFSAADDGLAQDWRGRVWLNPPYGRRGGGIAAWMDKAREASVAGATVVCLVPARTDTRWWHESAMRAAEVRLIRGRLHFGAGHAPAPFPSAIVVFRSGHSGPPCFSAVNARDLSARR